MTIESRRFGRPTPDQSAALKERVLDEALTAIRVKGASGLSMDLLAAQAGVTKRTIYRQFGSKLMLIDAVVDRELERLQRLPDRNDLEAEPLARLRYWAEQFYETILRPDVIAFANYLSFEATAEPDLQAKQRAWHVRMVSHLCEIVTAAQREGLLKPTPPQQHVFLLIDMISGPGLRKRFYATDEMAFVDLGKDEFFRSRWEMFLAVAGTRSAWLEPE